MNMNDDGDHHLRSLVRNLYVYSYLSLTEWPYFSCLTYIFEVRRVKRV
jgi:hypothetical protein